MAFNGLPTVLVILFDSKALYYKYVIMVHTVLPSTDE